MSEELNEVESESDDDSEGLSGDETCGTHVVHRLHLQLGSHKITLLQNPDSSMLGSTTWDAGIILARYFAEHGQDSDFKGKNVIELGAGTGAIGIYLAARGRGL